MKKINSLYVPERSAAILYASGEGVMVSLKREYDPKKKRNIQKYSSTDFDGIRNLMAEVFTCAGVMFQNYDDYVLIHAVWENNQENLKGLLKKISRLSIKHAGKKPKDIFLCTTNPEPEYERAIYEIIGNVNLRRHMRYRGKLGIAPQNIAIGKDVLCFI